MKRLLSLILSIIMIISIAPGVLVYAAENTSGEWVTLQMYDKDGNPDGEKTVWVPNVVSVKRTYSSTSNVNHKYELARSMLAKMTNGSSLVSAYDMSVEAIEQKTDTIDISSLNIAKDYCYLILNAIYADHPELFWFNGSFGYGTDDTKTKLTIIQFGYYDYSDTTLASMKELFDDSIDEALSCVTDYMTEYEKELALHDYLVDLIDYEIAKEGQEDQSAYSALVGHKTVCSGYSKAFQLLLREVGIESLYVSGIASSGSLAGAHAWNLVEIDGTYAWVDVTWDDPLNSDTIVYTYFNLDDDTIESDHTLEDPTDTAYLYYAYMPDCTSLAYTKANVDATFVDMSSSISVTDVANMLKSPFLDANGFGTKINIKNGAVSDFVSWFNNNVASVLSATGQNCSNTYKVGTDTKNNDFYLYLESPSGTGTLYGSIKTNYYSNTPVTLTIKDVSDGTVVFENTYEGLDVNYIVYGLTPGTYAISVSKQCNVSFSTSVVIESGAVTTKDITLELIGDINGDKHITTADVERLVGHVLGTRLLKGTSLALADINADDAVNNRDISFSLRNILGTESITGIKETITASSNTPTISGPNVSIMVNPGDTVSIPVSISENIGLMGYKLSFSFDSTKLTPTSNCVERNNDIFNVTGDNFASKVSSKKIDVLYSGVENVLNNGTLFNLNFDVSNDIDVNYFDITISYDADSTFDGYWKSVAVTTETIRIYIYQDAPTGLNSVNTTTITSNDGKITGTTAKMEWNTSEDALTGWAACSDNETTGFAPGTYYVRFKATDTSAASTSVKVVVAKHFHTFEVENTDDIYFKSAATCGEKAKYYYSCSCGECGTETFEYGETLDHNFGAWQKYDSAQHKRVCANDPSHEEYEDHSWNDGEVTKKATCTSTGVKVYTCTVCGATKNTTISKTAHKYSSTTKKCSCGKVNPSYTGLLKNSSGAYVYYVKGVASTKTSVVTLSSSSKYYASKKVYLSSGKVLTSYTGLKKDSSGNYWYVVKGVVSTKSGLLNMPSKSTYYKNRTVYLSKGKVITSYTGLKKDTSGNYWYVVKGVVSTSTGLYKMPSGSSYAGKTIYIKNGKFMISYTGLVKVNSKYKYVVKGIFTTKTGSVKIPSTSTYYKGKTVKLKSGVKV